MGIFNEFSIALAQAVADFELERSKKGQEISGLCREDLKQFKAIIVKNEDEISLIDLRNLVVDRVNLMSLSWFHLLPIHFERSNLRMKIVAVLERYPESTLLSKECYEARQHQKLVGKGEDGTDYLKKIEVLDKQLEEESKKTAASIQLCKELRVYTDKLMDELAESDSKNLRLEREINELQVHLKNNLEDLKVKIQEQDELILQLQNQNGTLMQANCQLAEEIEKHKSAYAELLVSHLNIAEENERLRAEIAELRKGRVKIISQEETKEKRSSIFFSFKRTGSN